MKASDNTQLLCDYDHYCNDSVNLPVLTHHYYRDYASDTDQQH